MVVSDLDEFLARAVADEIGGMAFKTDVSIESDLRNLVDRVTSTVGPIDLFCSNAGIILNGGPETPDAEWQRLQGLPEPHLQPAVLASWVRKEAAIKWHQGSIAQDLRHWLWDDNRGELLHLQRGWRPSSALRLHDGWCCAVVGDAAEQGFWA